MASSKEDISVPTNETENPVIGSCMNDPNYAIICAFLQKFGSQLKIEHPNIVQLQKMIENTDEGESILKHITYTMPIMFVHTYNDIYRLVFTSECSGGLNIFECIFFFFFSFVS